MIPARDGRRRYIVRGRIYTYGENAAYAALADRIGSRGLFDRVYNYTSPVPYVVRYGHRGDITPALGRPLTPREFAH